MGILFHCLLLFWLADSAFSVHNVLPTFFNKHRQRCNCAGKKACNRNGTCSPGTCEPGFVGVTCQHASIEKIKETVAADNKVLIDGNDDTCVGVANMGYDPSEPFYLFWIYISTKTKLPHTIGKKDVLYVEEKNGIKIAAEFYFIHINDNTLLIKLEENNVQYGGIHIQLSKIATVICSVEIGIGRNVALFAKAEQSSKHQNFDAINAVDGYEEITIAKTNPFEDFNGRSIFCTHTKLRSKDDTQWWKARLQYDARVNLVELLNRAIQQCRLNYFRLELQNDDDGVVFSKNNTDTRDVDLYSVRVTSSKPVRTVQIFIDKQNEPTQSKKCKSYGVVTLCEVSVFGEFICPANKFGPLCETYCPTCSQDSHRCDPDWGCATRCGGDWCLEGCSKHCVGSNRCDPTTYECDYGCERGYYPPLCTDRCVDGYYGLRCSYWCVGCVKNASSEKGTCDHRSGVCFHGCLDGYIGKNCVRQVVPESLVTHLVKTFSGAFILSILVLVFYFSTLGRRHFVRKRASEGWWSGDTFVEEAAGEDVSVALQQSASGKERTGANNYTAERKAIEVHSYSTKRKSIEMPRNIDLSKRKSIETPRNNDSTKRKSIEMPRNIDSSKRKSIKMPHKNDSTKRKSIDSSTDSEPALETSSNESDAPSSDSRSFANVRFDFQRRSYDFKNFI